MKRFITLVSVIMLLLVCSVHAGQLTCPRLPSGSMIKLENRFFDVWPKIVPADQESTVEIVPLFEHVQFQENCTYELTYTPMMKLSQDGG